MQTFLAVHGYWKGSNYQQESKDIEAQNPDKALEKALCYFDLTGESEVLIRDKDTLLIEYTE